MPPEGDTNELNTSHPQEWLKTIKTSTGLEVSYYDPVHAPLGPLKTIRTSRLEVAYYERGPTSGVPVVLSHGFPYDPHAYDSVISLLEPHSARVLVPYLRGFGPTQFLSKAQERCGQQAALASDLISFLDALGISKAILGGFDWGGLASCNAAALWPERVAGLVCYGGYDIYNRKEQQQGFDPQLESVMWYQHLFLSERGRICLKRDGKQLCKMLWRQWSPTWHFPEELFDRTAHSFNDDFVDVVIHAYRHVHGLEDGDPELQELEDKLAMKPKITVPTVTLDGLKDPLKPGGSAAHSAMFTGRHERKVYDNVGHAFPYEHPQAFAEAVLLVNQWAT